MNATVHRRALQHANHPGALGLRQAFERRWVHDDGVEGKLGGRCPRRQIADFRVNAAGQPGADRRLHHPVERIHLRCEGRNVAPVRREVERRDLIQGSRNQNARFGRRLKSADENIVGPEAPALGSPKLVDQFESLASPGVVRRKAEALEDDSVHLVAQQQLRECELWLGGERRHRFVADCEEDAPRHRLLVVLDFLLDEPLVLVLERARQPLNCGHAVTGSEERGVGQKVEVMVTFASAHAGSTWTVTSDVPNSRSIAASTASARRCASSTDVDSDSAIVTSAKSWPDAVERDRPFRTSRISGTASTTLLSSWAAMARSPSRKGINWRRMR